MKQINVTLIKVLSACLLLSFAVQCCAATTVSIADTTADPGDVVAVPLMVNDVTDYGSGTINIAYNSSVVHVTDVTSSSNSTVLAFDNNNVTGLTQISALNSGGASGDITFANVKFTAVGAGSSPLNIDVVTLYDRSFNKIHETATVDNGLFTVSGEGSTTPTPTTTHRPRSSSGRSSTGSVSITTPTPSPTPEPSAIDADDVDMAPTSESTPQNDREADEEIDTPGTTSPTVKPTPNSQKAPGLEAVFAVIALVIVSLITRRDNT